MTPARLILGVSAALALCGPAAAGEANVALRPGAGLEVVQTRCASCHSLDYIPMNSPFPDRKLWEAEVNKMIKAFGAPIAASDVPAIVDYLEQQYGRR